LNFQEKRAEALAAAQEGLRYDVSDAGCRNEQLRALVALNRLDEAEARAKEAIAEDPENDDFHHWLAAVYAHTGRYDLALPHAREAVRLDPSDTNYQTTFLQSLAAQPLLSRLIIHVFHDAQQYMRIVVLPPMCWAYWLLGVVIAVAGVWCSGHFPNALVAGTLVLIAVTWLILLPIIGIFLGSIAPPTIDLLLASHRESRRYLTRWQIACNVTVPAYFTLMVVTLVAIVQVDNQAGRDEISGWPVAAFWMSIFTVWACSQLDTIRAKAIGYLIGSSQLMAMTVTGLLVLVAGIPNLMLIVGIASVATTVIVCLACVVVYSRRPGR
jgi:hypothetical protein